MKKKKALTVDGSIFVLRGMLATIERIKEESAKTIGAKSAAIGAKEEIALLIDMLRRQ